MCFWRETEIIVIASVKSASTSAKTRMRRSGIPSIILLCTHLMIKTMFLTLSIKQFCIHWHRLTRRQLRKDTNYQNLYSFCLSTGKVIQQKYITHFHISTRPASTCQFNRTIRIYQPCLLRYFNMPTSIVCRNLKHNSSNIQVCLMFLKVCFLFFSPE